MSKRLDVKKEAALRLNQFYTALETKPGKPSTDDSEVKIKYNLLLKRFKELEKVYEFHRDIIQNISGSIITIDSDAKITFMNRSGLNSLGYDHKQIQGMPLLDLFADRDEGEMIIQRILVNKVPFESKETHLITSSESIIPVGFTTSYLTGENGKQGSVLVIFRNITQVTNLRKQIERMDRLATLGELSAGIAHEIRNPLAGIKTSAQVLEESFSPADFRSQLVSRIVKEIDRSNELLKRFFNFAKPSKPKQVYHDIEMIIDGVYLLLAPRLRKKKINFRTSFNENTPQVYIDESQIEQVILNLFLNAVEAMDNGGEMFVETGVKERVKIREDDPERKVVFVRVTDTGVGIAPDKVEKIFNPFYTTKSDGIGLGLSISTRLLEENGGKIEVESEEGKGSAFSFYVPIIN